MVSVLLVTAAYALWAQRANDQAKTCARMAQLCTDPEEGNATYDGVSTAACADELRGVRERAGARGVFDALRCMDRAHTCAESNGCLARRDARRGWGRRALSRWRARRVLSSGRQADANR